MLGVGRRAEVDASWEAFQFFQSWLINDTYNNIEYESTHIDAYQLSKTLKSPRFGNAVMKKVLAIIPSRKFDSDLKDTLREISKKCAQGSPLRSLYFEAYHYWSMIPSYHLLGLDEELMKDRDLAAVLETHPLDTCPCTEKYREFVEANDVSSEDVHHAIEDKDEGMKSCICSLGPWHQNPARFFAAA